MFFCPTSECIDRAVAGYYWPLRPRPKSEKRRKERNKTTRNRLSAKATPGQNPKQWDDPERQLENQRFPRSQTCTP
eukprot:1796442-Pyramimonas_sp.AAC.1